MPGLRERQKRGEPDGRLVVVGFASFTEQTARSVITFRDEAVFQHWLEGLRKAGWEG